MIVERTTNGGKPVRAFSITKSVTALLVGMAQDDGKLRIDDPVADFVSEWHGTPSSAVTIRDILTNTSGRQWDSRTDYAEMALKAEDKTAFAVALKQENDPGSVWTYNNSAVQVLEAVLESAWGAPVDEFASEQLFQPLGMDNSRIERDEAGNANLFAGLWTTCDDLVRLGELVLNDGVGPSGDRLVSAEYIRAATGSPSTKLNAAYGHLWWLNHSGPAVTPEVATTGKGGAINGPLVPAASDDIVWALGFHSQILAVMPSQGAVAVRLGEEPPKSADLTVRLFTEHVLAALTAADSDEP
ncbi:CubicO group peptidase (beta-lactamase class C family) [Microbacterium trichothecenolyticum]|nr:CubicO group peptidase (beta-lactamase class C family) [Microbacterium trichothecenolyticum]